MSRLRVRQLILATIVLISIGLSSSRAGEYAFGLDSTLLVADDPHIKLDWLAGDVVVRVGSTDAIRIEAIRRIDALTHREAAEIAEQLPIRIHRQGNKVTLGADYLRIEKRRGGFWNKLLGKAETQVFARIDWQLTVPPSTSLEIAVETGRVAVDGLRGDVSINAELTEIAVASLEGSLDINATSSVTDISLVIGDVTIRQTSGDANLALIEGDIRIRTQAADITVGQERGALDIETKSGDVDVSTALDSERDLFIVTESGNITLEVPEYASGDLHIKSGVGDITTEMPLRIEDVSRREISGQFGHGGILVELRSGSGKVTIAQF